MRYESDSDTAMAIDRKRRADDVKAKAFRKLEDEAKKLGYSLVKHCPQCNSIQA